jgi:hypothetical protein
MSLQGDGSLTAHVCTELSTPVASKELTWSCQQRVGCTAIDIDVAKGHHAHVCVAINFKVLIDRTDKLGGADLRKEV